MPFRRKIIGAYTSSSEASAFFAVVGGLPSSKKIAVDKFIRGLKADGLWDKMDRLYINVGSSITDHAVCLKTLTSRTAVNSPTWHARGTTYNGTTNYFRGDAHVDTYTNTSISGATLGTFFDPSIFSFASNLVGVFISGKNYYISSAVGS